MKTMRALLQDRRIRICALLVAITLVSSQIGGAGGQARIGSAAIVTISVLGIAFAKAWMVMFGFMELRTAPLALRIAATVWLAVVLAVLLAIYLGLMG